MARSILSTEVRRGYIPLNILVKPYSSWLEAIKNDDHVVVSRTLGTSTETERKRRLHEEIEFLDIESAKHISSRPCKFTRPFTLAVVYGSINVCHVMIHNDVDVCLVESGSYNFIHCLFCVAFYQPENEEAVVKTYNSLCRMLSVDVIRKLLHMEESNGLRPLEFAAQQRTLQLMSAIFYTPEVYVRRQHSTGLTVYKWYDVTEYQTTGVSASRSSVSPRSE